MIGDKKRIFFTDSEGKEIDGEEVPEKGTNLHEILANYIIENDTELKEKFLKSKITYKTIFLIIEGYLYGTEMEEGSKEILCYPPNISSKEKEMLFEYYRPEGYEFYNIEKIMGRRFKEVLGEEQVEEIEDIKEQDGENR